MLILIIIPIIAVFIYIGIRLNKVDRYLNERGFIAIEPNPAAIILGEGEISMHVAALLEKRGIESYMLSEPYILNHEKPFRYLFALSGDDADNILMCKIARKIYRVEEMISLCSDRANEDIYRSENIPYILTETVNADTLMGMVFKRQEACL